MFKLCLGSSGARVLYCNPFFLKWVLAMPPSCIAVIVSLLMPPHRLTLYYAPCHLATRHAPRATLQHEDASFD